jgi:hypothetical protein
MTNHDEDLITNLAQTRTSSSRRGADALVMVTHAEVGNQRPPRHRRIRFVFRAFYVLALLTLISFHFIPSGRSLLIVDLCLFAVIVCWCLLLDVFWDSMGQSTARMSFYGTTILFFVSVLLNLMEVLDERNLPLTLMLSSLGYTNCFSGVTPHPETTRRAKVVLRWITIAVSLLIIECVVYICWIVLRY